MPLGDRVPIDRHPDELHGFYVNMESGEVFRVFANDPPVEDDWGYLEHIGWLTTTAPTYEEG